MADLVSGFFSYNLLIKYIVIQQGAVNNLTLLQKLQCIDVIITVLCYL